MRNDIIYVRDEELSLHCSTPAGIKERPGTSILTSGNSSIVIILVPSESLNTKDEGALLIIFLLLTKSIQAQSIQAQHKENAQRTMIYGSSTSHTQPVPIPPDNHADSFQTRKQSLCQELHISAAGINYNY